MGNAGRIAIRISIFTPSLKQENTLGDSGIAQKMWQIRID